MAPGKKETAVRRSIAAAVQFGHDYPLTNSERRLHAVYADLPGYREYVRYPDQSKRKPA